VTEKTRATHPVGRTIEWGAGAGATTEFELLYRANVDTVTAYFARRAAEPEIDAAPVKRFQRCLTNLAGCVHRSTPA